MVSRGCRGFNELPHGSLTVWTIMCFSVSEDMNMYEHISRNDRYSVIWINFNHLFAFFYWRVYDGEQVPNMTSKL